MCRGSLKRTNPHFFELKIEILTFRSNKKKIYLSLENFSYPLGLNYFVILKNNQPNFDQNVAEFWWICLDRRLLKIKSHLFSFLFLTTHLIFDKRSASFRPNPKRGLTERRKFRNDASHPQKYSIRSIRAPDSGLCELYPKHLERKRVFSSRSCIGILL